MNRSGADKEAGEGVANIESVSTTKHRTNRRRSNNGGSTSPAPSLLSTASSGSPLVRAGSSISASSSSTTASSTSTGSAASSTIRELASRNDPNVLSGGSVSSRRPAPTKIAAAQLQCQQQLGELANNKLAINGATANQLLKGKSMLMSEDKDKKYRAAKMSSADYKPQKPKAEAFSSSKHANEKSFGYNLAKSIAFRANRFNEFWSTNKMRYLNFVCLLMTLVCLLTILLLSGSERSNSNPNISNSDPNQLSPILSRQLNPKQRSSTGVAPQQSGAESIDSMDSSVVAQPLVRKPFSSVDRNTIGSDETIVDHNGRDNNEVAADNNSNNNNNSINSNEDDSNDNDENPFDSLFDDSRVGSTGSKSRRDSASASSTSGLSNIDDELLSPSKRLSSFLSSSSSANSQEHPHLSGSGESSLAPGEAITIGFSSPTERTQSTQQLFADHKHHPHRSPSSLTPMLLEPMFSQLFDDFGGGLFRQLLASSNDSQLGSKPIVRRHKNGGATIIISSSSSALPQIINATESAANSNETSKSTAGTGSNSTNLDGAEQLPMILEKLLPPMLRPLALLGSSAARASGGQTTKTVQTPFGTATITISSSPPMLLGSGGANDPFRPLLMPAFESRLSSSSSASQRSPMFAPAHFADGPSIFAPVRPSAAMFAPRWTPAPFLPPPPGLMSLLMRATPFASATIIDDTINDAGNTKNKTIDPIVSATNLNETAIATSNSSPGNNATATMSNATMATTDMKTEASTSVNKTTSSLDSSASSKDDDVEIFDVARMLQQVGAKTRSNRYDGGALRMRPTHLPGSSRPMFILSGSDAKEALPFDGPHPMFRAQQSAMRPSMIAPHLLSPGNAAEYPMLRAILGNVVSELSSGERKSIDRDSDNEDNDWSSFSEPSAAAFFPRFSHPSASIHHMKPTATSPETKVVSSETISDISSESESTGVGNGNPTSSLISGTIKQTFHGPGVTVERIIELPRSKQQHLHSQSQPQVVPAGTRSQSLSSRADFSSGELDNSDQSISSEYPIPPLFAMASSRSSALPIPFESSSSSASSQHPMAATLAMRQNTINDQSNVPAGPIGDFIRQLLSDIGTRRVSPTSTRVSKRLSIEDDIGSDDSNVDSTDDFPPDRSPMMSFGPEPRIRIASARIRLPRPALFAAGPDGMFPGTPFSSVERERELLEPPMMRFQASTGEQRPNQQSSVNEDSLSSIDERLSHALSLLHNDVTQQTFDKPSTSTTTTTSSTMALDPSKRSESTASDHQSAQVTANDNQQQPSTIVSSISEPEQQYQAKSRDPGETGVSSVVAATGPLPLGQMNARAQPKDHNQNQNGSPFTSPSSPLFGFPMSGVAQLQQEQENRIKSDQSTSSISGKRADNNFAQDESHQQRRGRAFTYHSNHEIAGSQARQANQQQQNQENDSILRQSSRLPPPAAVVMGRRLDDGPFEEEASSSGELVSSDSHLVQERQHLGEQRHSSNEDQQQKAANQQNDNGPILFRGRAMPTQQQVQQNQQQHPTLDNYRTIVV